MTDTRGEFIEVKFQSNSTRRYTYHAAGAKFEVGEKGNVETDRGIVTVEVTRLGLPEPSFATRPIVKLDAPLPRGALAAALDGKATGEANADHAKIAADPPPSPPAHSAPPTGRRRKSEAADVIEDLKRGESPKPEGIDQQ